LQLNRGTIFSGRRQFPLHCRSVMHNENPSSNPLAGNRLRDTDARRTDFARRSGFRLIRRKPFGK
jgi:hypothetical protein